MAICSGALIEDECLISAIGFGILIAHTVLSSQVFLLSCRSVVSSGGDTEFAFMPAAYDALDQDTKMEIEELVTEHSLLYSRELGFTEFEDEERKALLS